MSFYSQIIPSELRELLLYYISGYELVNICSDSNSIFYHHRCKDDTFWKDKILADFSIKNNKWKKAIYVCVIDGVLTENCIGTKYDIFKEVKDYNLQWLYKVFHCYFNDKKVENQHTYVNLPYLLFEIFEYSGRHIDNIELLDELMKSPSAVSQLILRNDIEVLGYIYDNYPQYSKTLLLNLLFTNKDLATKFQNKYKPQETFSFSELEEIINDTLTEEIVGNDIGPEIDDEIDRFNKHTIRILLTEKENQTFSTEGNEPMKCKVTIQTVKP